MKFNNFDVVFTRNLQSYNSMSSVIHIERITCNDPIEMTLEMVHKLLKSFFDLSTVKYKLGQLDLPIEVSNLITDFKKSEVQVKSVEDLTCTLSYFGFNLMIIGRVGLTGPDENFDENYYYRSYLINNFSDNVSGLSCVYSGYSLIYDDSGVPTAFDYIKSFGLSQDQMQLFELNVASDSYEYLSSNKQLDQFDDTKSLEFIYSRGYKYMVIVNPI